jgi:penicillin-binding protein 1B
VWLRALLLVATVAVASAGGVIGYYYVHFARLINARLEGGRDRTPPQVFGRPFVLRQGQALTSEELVDRLNDLGYAQRARLDGPGEFVVGDATVMLTSRGGASPGRRIRVVFSAARAGRRPPGGGAGTRIEALEIAGQGTTDSLTVDAPMISALVTPGREKRRKVPLANIPPHVREAVLAIEDRRFYDHPGVDVIRTASALVTNVRGERPYLVGGSTLTQQLVKNFFLTREKTIRRKLLEQFMAIILERRLTKDEILELYLNDVYLGQRGSFAIHGVAEAARMYFGKDVSNLGLAEAATIAGAIQAPPQYSPFRAPDRARDRRNVVLRAMVETGYISPEAGQAAAAEPLNPVATALDAEAPYFVDMVGQTFAEQFPELTTSVRPVEIHTTLDIHLQRIAQTVLVDGLARVDEQLAKRRRRTGAQGALLAVDPRTGEVLAFVGGRAYGRSQFNRVTSARRQPGSVFKPFVYLAAFELAAAEGRTELTPATVVVDEPTTFLFGDEEWAPGNYGDEYDGPITLRRALAMSRNVATAKVAEIVGFDRIASLWRQVGTTTAPRAYPSIALGVFEATPWEIAQAYTVFANGGELRPLQAMRRVVSDGVDLPVAPPPPGRRLARADTAFLVTDMMRSVLTEGTGASARAAGFTLDAAGKSGTTNDLRDAWFVGFTPELLAVVWVGFDDNQAIGLSGSQAALPIWTAFMMRALAGHANVPFRPPASGVVLVEIDRDTGLLPSPGCPRLRTEVFLEGSEPTLLCTEHGH